MASKFWNICKEKFLPNRAKHKTIDGPEAPVTRDSNISDSKPKSKVNSDRWISLPTDHEARVHGFEAEIMSMKKLIGVGIGTGTREEFKAVGVVGISGVGKTTLCQELLRRLAREMAEPTFTPRIWVSMPRNELPKARTENKIEARSVPRDSEVTAAMQTENMISRLVKLTRIQTRVLVDPPKDAGLPRQPSDLNQTRKIEVLEMVLTALGFEDKITEIDGVSSDDHQRLAGLLYALRLSLLGKRYLIVFDDVMEGDTWWRSLSESTPLPRLESTEVRLAAGLPKTGGGRVIVTSSNEKIAKAIVTKDSNLHRLLPLVSDPASLWKIFEDAVIKFEPKLNVSNLEETIKQVNSEELRFGKNVDMMKILKEMVVSKCNGLPSAAILMAKTALENRQRILEEEEKKKQKAQKDLEAMEKRKSEEKIEEQMKKDNAGDKESSPPMGKEGREVKDERGKPETSSDGRSRVRELGKREKQESSEEEEKEESKAPERKEEAKEEKIEEDSRKKDDGEEKEEARDGEGYGGEGKEDKTVKKDEEKKEETPKEAKETEMIKGGEDGKEHKEEEKEAVKQVEETKVDEKKEHKEEEKEAVKQVDEKKERKEEEKEAMKQVEETKVEKKEQKEEEKEAAKQVEETKVDEKKEQREKEEKEAVKQVEKTKVEEKKEHKEEEKEAVKQVQETKFEEKALEKKQEHVQEGIKTAS